MNAKFNDAAKIMIATDSRAEAESIKSILHRDFSEVRSSYDQALAVQDFESFLPDVLVLAFSSIEQSQRHYLGLYRLSNRINLHPHRAIVLCSKEELKAAFELCRKDYFDDYVLFWPVPYDGHRLLMSICVSLRELRRASGPGIEGGRLISHAKDLSELERTLDEQVTLGRRQIELTSEQIQQSGSQLSSAIDALINRFQLDALARDVTFNDSGAWAAELSQFTVSELRPLIETGKLAVEPLRRWVHELEQQCSAQLAKTRSLISFINQLPRRILVIDDDEFSQKVVCRLLERDGYEVASAGSSAEALTLMRNMRPSLILMGYMLPGEDGVTLTKRLKESESFADIPIIMLTGQRNRQTVVNSLLVGASDFVAKPINPSVLLAKIARYLNREQGLASAFNDEPP